MQVDRWSYFQPNWNWSLQVLDSEETFAKIARAAVIPFLLISSFEAFVVTAQFIANLAILGANKIEKLIYCLPNSIYYDCFRH
jgi:hypothetical protein